MQLPLIITISAALIVTCVLLLLVGRFRKNNQQCEQNLATASREKADLVRRLGSIPDVEVEVARLRASLDEEKKSASLEAARVKDETEKLRDRYSQALKTFETLQAEVGKLEEDLDDVSYGLYRPHFTYESSDDYKAAIEAVRDRQKALIKAGKAVSCSAQWSVGGSAVQGAKMTKQYEKIVLRAFNAETEAAIANVAWSNYNVMRERIEKGFEALNKLGTVMQLSLSIAYKDERLTELKLVFEAAEKRQQEKEEQKRIRAEQREEERVQRELIKEKEDAEKDEGKFEKSLDKIRRDIENSVGAERDALQAKIIQLEADLAAAHERKARAIAQAQLTKAGHVYIISNVGAFGEGVLKIGLTRRLEPEERIQELGDASVPFPFDIHALIYSENAPELETRLQNHFWDKRLNWVNDRKEFFRIPLNEVSAELHQLGFGVKVLSIPEAKEYRQTVVALAENETKLTGIEAKHIGPKFPSDPFSST